MEKKINHYGKNLSSYEHNFELGMKQFREKNIDEAIKLWEKASQLDGSKAEIHSVLGSVYKLVNYFEKINAELEKEIELQPENFKFLYNYGLVLNEQGNFKEAIKILKQALLLEPENFELMNDIGVMYFNLKDYESAIDLLLESLEIAPDYLVPKINLGYVYIAKEDIASAKTIIGRLISENSSHIEIKELKKKLNEYLENNSIILKKEHINLEFSGKIFEITPLKILQDFETKLPQDTEELSIIVPIMDEEENIPILYKKLKNVLNELKQNYEIIFIDDGSTDTSLQKLTEISNTDERVKIIQFRKNYGQTAALSAGFKYAHGNVIITMDGDLQNDPADIPLLLEKMAEGYDLVNGWRKNRQDKNLSRKIPSKIANMIINKLIEGTKIQLHDFGCTLKAYKRGITKNIHLYGEMHRFIPVFAAWLGVKVAEIPVHHHPRIHGNAKYNLSRVPRVILDLLVVRFFSDSLTRPIQFFGKIARKMFSWGNVFLGLILIAKLIFGDKFPFSFDSVLILFGILTLTSFQVVVMGLLGEIMMRIYFEGQKKDYFIVEKIIQKEKKL